MVGKHRCVSWLEVHLGQSHSRDPAQWSFFQRLIFELCTSSSMWVLLVNKTGKSPCLSVLNIQRGSLPEPKLMPVPGSSNTYWLPGQPQGECVVPSSQSFIPYYRYSPLSYWFLLCFLNMPGSVLFRAFTLATNFLCLKYFRYILQAHFPVPLALPP